MSKSELVIKIAEMDHKLAETQEWSRMVNSAVSDAVDVVVPMMEDLLQIMRGVVETLPEEAAVTEIDLSHNHIAMPEIT